MRVSLALILLLVHLELVLSALTLKFIWCHIEESETIKGGQTNVTSATIRYGDGEDLKLIVKTKGKKDSIRIPGGKYARLMKKAKEKCGVQESIHQTLLKYCLTQPNTPNNTGTIKVGDHFPCLYLKITQKEFQGKIIELGSTVEIHVSGIGDPFNMTGTVVSTLDGLAYLQFRGISTFRGIEDYNGRTLTSDNNVFPVELNGEVYELITVDPPATSKLVTTSCDADFDVDCDPTIVPIAAQNPVSSGLGNTGESSSTSPLTSGNNNLTTKDFASRDASKAIVPVACSVRLCAPSTTVTSDTTVCKEGIVLKESSGCVIC